MLDGQTIIAPDITVSTKRTNAAPQDQGTAFTLSTNMKSEGAIVDSTGSQSHSTTALLPIMGVVLVALLVIGIALPVLPLHVHQGLGLSAFVVGLVTGSQFAASLISRGWSGHYADSRGASRGRIALRLANVPPCLIGIEAGMATHYVARELAELGHDVKQVPPTYAKPFRQGHKRCGIAWSASGPQ